MPRKSSAPATTTDIRHTDKRLNNPPAAIAGEGSVPLAPKYEYSAHRAPKLRFNAESETTTDPPQLSGVEICRLKSAPRYWNIPTNGFVA